MSWQMLDGPSRRPRLSWAVPEHLRDNSRYGPFRRLAVPAPLDPDALLQYIDNAISITENAQATRHLSLLFASASASSSSTSTSLTSSTSSLSASTSSSSLSSSSSSLASSSSLSVGHLREGGHLPVSSARKLSRFKSVPLQQKAHIDSSLIHSDHEEAIAASKLILPAVSQIMNVQPLDEEGSTKVDRFPSKLPESTKNQQCSEVEGVSKGDQLPDKGEDYDARAADDAYRAACCALSEGNAELALSLLHVASEKCPPDKQSALGKVHRLMAAAMQLMEKNSAVLRSLPVDKDA